MFGKPTKKTVFITVEKNGFKAMDYPSWLPLPRIGEFVSFDSKEQFTIIWGDVETIRHITVGNVSEIKIMLHDKKEDKNEEN